MKRKKHVVVDAAMEKDLALLCDLALKFANINIPAAVENVSKAIRSENPFGLDELEEEDW